MDPLISLGIPGLVGGVLLAFVLIKLQGRNRRDAAPDAFGRDPLSTDVINMSRIRVAGIGGLGLVAMALTVALNVPRIGQTVGAGLVLGAVWAAVMIVRRRREGPMPSSGQRMGANTTLAIDAPPLADRDAERDESATPPLQAVVPSAARV